MAYIPIASQTLGAAASSVTFNSIPTTLNGQTLRDLVLVCSVRSASGEGPFRMTFNGVTSASYFNVSMNGNGSSAFSANNNNASIQDDYTDVPTTGTATYVYNIMDYAQTDKHKSVLVRGNRANANVSAIAARFANTSAITSINLLVFGSNMAAGSTFSLYGVAA